MILPHLLTSFIQHIGIIFYVSHPHFLIINERDTSIPCELITFPRRSWPAPSTFSGRSQSQLWYWIHFHVHHSRGFRPVSRCSHFTFWQLAKKHGAQGFFLKSFSFTTWLKVDQARLLSSLSWAVPLVSNLEPGVTYTQERREWAKLSSDAHEIFSPQGWNTENKCKGFGSEVFCDLKEMPGIVIVLYNSTFLKMSVTVKGDSLVDSNCSVSL